MIDKIRITNMSKNINKIIEEQKELAIKKMISEGWSEQSANEAGDYTAEVAKQSIITLLDTLIEEKKGKRKNQCTHKYSQEDGYCHQCFTVLLNESPEDKGYNQCLDEDITNLTNIKNNIK